VNLPIGPDRELTAERVEGVSVNFPFPRTWNTPMVVLVSALMRRPPPSLLAMSAGVLLLLFENCPAAPVVPLLNAVTVGEPSVLVKAVFVSAPLPRTLTVTPATKTATIATTNTIRETSGLAKRDLT
jgi:hypothetical protein